MSSSLINIIRYFNTQRTDASGVHQIVSVTLSTTDENHLYFHMMKLFTEQLSSVHVHIFIINRIYTKTRNYKTNTFSQT